MAYLDANVPVMITTEEIALLSDHTFFMAKAKISAKIRSALDELLPNLQHELRKKQLVTPNDFSLDAFQFVKGEHLEECPYQYLDFPRYYTKNEKLAFRSLFWWGHHIVFSLLIEGGHLRQYKENLINRYAAIADQQICLGLSPSLWEWKQGAGYTLELTRTRKSEVAAVLAHRPFFKLSIFVPWGHPSVTNNMIVDHGRQALHAMLPVITR